MHRFYRAFAALVVVIPLLGSPVVGGVDSSQAAPGVSHDMWPTTLQMLERMSVEELIDRDQVFRRNSALQADREFVASLYDNPALQEEPRFLNVLLTSDERIELEERQALSADNKVLLDYVNAHGLEGQFAGSFIDHQAGGLFVARFTDDLEIHRSALAAMVPHVERLSVRSAAWSLAQLTTWSDLLYADRQDLADQGLEVYVSGPDVELNASFIEVPFTTDPLLAREILRGNYDESMVSAIDIRTVEGPPI